MPWARDKLFQIIHRLEGDSGLARTDAIERFAQDETLDELVASIERDIAANKPHVALDRLHTYCMKKFAHLVVARGEQPAPGETLNARARRAIFQSVATLGADQADLRENHEVDCRNIRTLQQHL